MPEGPEVRRCAEQLERFIINREIVEIRAEAGKLYRELGRSPWRYDHDSFPASMPSILFIDVKGKVIFMRMTNKLTLISTLGMTGWWYPDVSPTSPEASGQAYVDGALVNVKDVLEKSMKHARLRIIFNEGPAAVFVDQRNFGNIRLESYETAAKLEQAIGLDLLYEVCDDEGLAVAVKRLKTKPKKMICDVLLDQTVLSGLGNIYRAETLYIAKVNPFKKIADIIDDDLEKIVWVAVNVLHIAYKGRGAMSYPIDFLTDTMDIVSVNLSPDKKATGHLVYGREHDMFGHKTIRDKSAGRTMWWVPQIQQ